MLRRTLLTHDQRGRLFKVPTDRAEMAKHYVLSAQNLDVIRTKRRSANRLGFAVQLCLLSYPGRALSRGETPPFAVIAFIGDQLGIDPMTFDDLRPPRRNAA